MSSRLSLLLGLAVACAGGKAGDEDDDGDAEEGAEGGDGESSCAGTGFAGTAVQWTLPTGFPEGTFVALAGAGAVSWNLLDLSGDGRVDIVVTDWDGASIDGLGTTKWLVYEGQDGGFSDTPSQWTLPGGFEGDAFVALASGDPDLSFGLLDLDADGAVDLVVSKWDDASVEGLGTTKWLVYANSGGGFADTPSQWSLPTGHEDGTFEAVAGFGDVSFGLVSLDGDGGADLVITSWDDASIDGLGTTKWLVHDNTGAGFAGSPTQWALPEGFDVDEFAALGPEGSDVTWGLLDLAASGAPELVVARWDNASIDGLGESQWLRFPNTGSGFGDAPSAWALPDGFDADTFEQFAGGDGDPTWGLLNLPGQGGPEIVVTRWDSASIDSLGETQWLVYGDASDGHTEAGRSWVLPEGFPSGTFEAFAGTSEVGWSLLDLNVDARPDLVVTRWDGASIDGLGTTKWLVYDNVCD